MHLLSRLFIECGRRDREEVKVSQLSQSKYYKYFASKINKYSKRGLETEEDEARRVLKYVYFVAFPSEKLCIAAFPLTPAFLGIIYSLP